MAAYTSPLAEELAHDVLDRFLRYVRVDTQSRRDREQSPSTPGQLELAQMLVDELVEAGLPGAELDDNGYVMAKLPATIGDAAPGVGLIAHVDTSPEEPGAGVEPIVHRALRRRADRPPPRGDGARSRADARAGGEGRP
jgi:tripeptide aminopeptidase